MPNKESRANKFIIIIAGPTAVGKTAVSIELAKAYDADIFSADSRQLFKEMSIGTAKPSLIDMKSVHHHFIDHISIHDSYSVGQYEKDIKQKLASYFEQKDIAIVCGGTGLYIRALVEGLDDFPDIPEEISNIYNEGYSIHGLPWLQEMVSVKDPMYFLVVDKQNHRRLIRALCVMHTTGKTYSELLSLKAENKVPYNIIQVLLDIPRDELYERINARVDQMMVQGLEAEAKSLYAYNGLRSLETVGYQELFDYFDGNTDLSTAVALIKQNSRRYAKRQMTWFRKYGDWQVFAPNQIPAIKSYIDTQIVK